MSKAKAKTEKVEAVVEVVNAEVKAEVKTNPIIAQPKLVKIIPKFTGKKFIGNKWYELVKDKEIEVPAEVKRVLKEARAIYL